jgi:hypothetical protein
MGDVNEGKTQAFCISFNSICISLRIFKSSAARVRRATKHPDR